MAIYRTFRSSGRDFTMLKAALLAALLVLAQLLATMQDADGEVAQDAMNQPQVFRVLVQGCDESRGAGPLI